EGRSVWPARRSGSNRIYSGGYACRPGVCTLFFPEYAPDLGSPRHSAGPWRPLLRSNSELLRERLPYKFVRARDSAFRSPHSRAKPATSSSPRVLGRHRVCDCIAFSRSFLEGVVTEPWNRPNVLMLNAGVLLLFFAIAGVRAIFVLPAALPANWVFRVTNIEKVRARIAANRKTLILLVAVPVWIACALVYFAIWPFLPALQHVIVLFLIAAILVELSPYQFHKIPFTCS